MEGESEKKKKKMDLWEAVRDGSLAEVESALKKNGGYVNSRNAFGLTPLHIATWRNHIPILSLLLSSGSDPDFRVLPFSLFSCVDIALISCVILTLIYLCTCIDLFCCVF